MTFKILALTTGFGNLLVLHRFHVPSSRPVAINHCYVLSFFARKPYVVFQCFHTRIANRLFASLATSATRRYQHDVLQGAHVQNILLCVAFGRALIRDPKSVILQMLKMYYVFHYYLSFVVRTTVCVAPRARRRSVPSRVLGDTLAASAARSRPECRHKLDLSEFDPPRPPRSTLDILQEVHHQHISTTKVVSSVVGCAMHMKWPDGIGLGSWDWENPRQGSANQIPALPVLTGHAVGCSRAGGRGQAPLWLLLL